LIHIGGDHLDHRVKHFLIGSGPNKGPKLRR
jgi:hypothetical protein